MPKLLKSFRGYLKNKELISLIMLDLLVVLTIKKKVLNVLLKLKKEIKLSMLTFVYYQLEESHILQVLDLRMRVCPLLIEE